MRNVRRRETDFSFFCYLAAATALSNSELLNVSLDSDHTLQLNEWMQWAMFSD